MDKQIRRDNHPKKKEKIMEKIKVASFNLESCMNITKGYWQYATDLWKYYFPLSNRPLKKTAKLANKEKIDIMSIVEMEASSYRTNHIDLTKLFSKLTKLKNNVFFPTSLNMEHSQGNMISSKFKILKTKTHRLQSRRKMRVMGQAEIKTKTKTINIFVTHLALKKEWRTKEIKEISKIINKTKGPKILMGDFNITNKKEYDKIIKNTSLKPIGKHKTFPSWNPTRGLDAILFSKELKPLNSYVAKNHKCSDHLPLIAEFSIK